MTEADLRLQSVIYKTKDIIGFIDRASKAFRIIVDADAAHRVGVHIWEV